MRNFVLIGIFVFLMLSVSAVALPAGGLNITEVKINTSGPVGCNEMVRFYATVKDTFNGSSGIIKVQFQILDWTGESFLASATRLNGTDLDGTWVYDYTLTDPEVDLLRLWGVRVENAGHVVCFAQSTSQTDSCNFVFSTPLEAEGNCTCDSSYIDGSCTIYNYFVRNYTYSASCPTQSSSARIPCDYCDPLWTSSIASCTISNFSTQTGTSIITYSPGAAGSPNGTYCCQSTAAGAGRIIYNHQGGSDCKSPPVDGINMSCTLDSWLGYYNDEQTGINSNSKGVVLEGMNQISAANGAKDYTQPLVWDIDNDGKSEIIISSQIGILVYSQGASSLTLESSYLGDFVGQPALFGVEESGGVYSCVSDCEVRLIVGDNSSGNPKNLLIFNFSQNNINLESNVSLPTISGQQIYLKGGNGFACRDKACYFVAYSPTGGTNYYSLLEKINTTTKSVSNLHNEFSTNVSWVDYSEVTPILTDDKIIFWISDDNTLAMARAVYYDGTSAGFYDTGGDLIIGGTYKDGYVYFTQEKEVASYTTYEFVRWDLDGVLAGDYKTEVWQGTGAGCITPPVNTRCGGTDDFAFMHYNGVSSVAVASDGFYGMSMRSDELETGLPRTATSVVFGDVQSLEDYTTLTYSYSLGSSVVSRYPLYIDSNGDGEMEFWVYSEYGLYVFDQNFALIDGVTISGVLVRPGTHIWSKFIEKPAADDLNNDGKVEVFFPYTYATSLDPWVYINSYVLSSDSSTIELLSTLNTSLNHSQLGTFEMNLGWDDDNLAGSLFLSYTEGPVANQAFDAKLRRYVMVGDNLSLSAQMTLPVFEVQYSIHIPDLFFIDATGDGDTELIMAYANKSGVAGIVAVFDFDTLALEKNFTISGFCMSAGALAATNIGTFAGFVEGSANANIIIAGARSTYGCFDVYTYSGALVRSVWYSLSLPSQYQSMMVNKGDNYYGYIAMLNSPAGMGGMAVNLHTGNYSVSNSAYSRSSNDRRSSFAVDVWDDVWFVNLEADAFAKDFTNMDDDSDENFTDDSMYGGWAVSYIDFNGDGYKDMFAEKAGDLRIYTWGGTPTNISTINSWLECFDGDTMVSVNKVALSGSSCAVSGALSSTRKNPSDLIGNYWDYVLASNGVYDFYTASKVMDLTKSAIPVDLNGDQFTDFVASGSSLTRAYFSPFETPAVTYSSTVDLYALQPCQVTSTGTGNNLASVGIWGSAPSTDIIYQVDFGDKYVAQQSYTGGDVYFYHVYEDSGAYTINAQMCSGGICDTQSCAVNATVTVSPDTGSGSCSLGYDGEFDYRTPIEDNGWIFDINSGITTLTPSNGILNMRVIPPFRMGHGASCNRAIMTVTFKAKASSTADFYVDVQGTYADLAIASIGFYNGDIMTGVNNTWIAIGSYVLDEYVEYKIILDSTTNTYGLYAGGVKIYDGPFSAIPSNNNFWDTSLLVGYQGGTVYLDYIRLEGGGSQIETAFTPDLVKQLTDEGFDLSKLSNCSNDGVSFQAAYKSGFVAQSFPTMLSYCADKSTEEESGFCNYDDLQNAVKVNPVCMREAMNYCVAKTYPQLDGAGSMNVGEGTTVCTAVLGVGVISKKIVLPAIGSIWSVIWANAEIAFIALAFILLAFALSKKK